MGHIDKRTLLAALDGDLGNEDHLQEALQLKGTLHIGTGHQVLGAVGKGGLNGRGTRARVNGVIDRTHLAPITGSQLHLEPQLQARDQPLGHGKLHRDRPKLVDHQEGPVLGLAHQVAGGQPQLAGPAPDR